MQERSALLRCLQVPGSGGNARLYRRYRDVTFGCGGGGLY
jgi:hypothetical protein